MSLQLLDDPSFRRLLETRGAPLTKTPAAMSRAQAEWLALVDTDGQLPRWWPRRRLNGAGGKRVSTRLIHACIRSGWVTRLPPFRLTPAGREALGLEVPAAAASRAKP